MTNVDVVSPAQRLGRLFRVEDLVLVGFVAVVSPLLFRVGGDKGPFDAGQPLAGVLRLAAVLGVLLCVSARKAAEPGAADQGSLVNRGVVGPLTGGVLLVTISGFTALGVSSTVTLVLIAGAGVVAVAMRFVAPPLSVVGRRALVAPFGAVAGGIYWSFIDAVLPNQQATALRHAAFIDPHAAMPVLLFLLAFSVIYYAMLVYAPRQIAEREGGWMVWVLRYLAFVASIALGVAWLGVLSA